MKNLLTRYDAVDDDVGANIVTKGHSHPLDTVSIISEYLFLWVTPGRVNPATTLNTNSFHLSNKTWLTASS